MRVNAEGQAIGLVTNIQRYTIHDGPGIRTEIFFKGCNLHCPWCSNPEAVVPNAEVGVYPEKCVGLQNCGFCIRACPLGEQTPLKFSSDGLPVPFVNPADCAGCLRCAEACPGSGLKLWGTGYTAEELLGLIRKDTGYYDKTGGGVTLNGGEALLQWEFAVQLLKLCRENGISTCVESALHIPWEHVSAVLEYTDYFICDIKHIDPERHRALTGADNRRILDNIRKIAARDIPLVIRTPVVCGYNDEAENISGIAEFIRRDLDNRPLQYQLLPYRKMGTEKLATLGREYPMGDYVPPEREEWEPNLLRLVEIARQSGVNAVAGSGKKWFEKAAE